MTSTQNLLIVFRREAHLSLTGPTIQVGRARALQAPRSTSRFRQQRPTRNLLIKARRPIFDNMAARKPRKQRLAKNCAVALRVDNPRFVIIAGVTVNRIASTTAQHNYNMFCNQCFQDDVNSKAMTCPRLILTLVVAMATTTNHCAQQCIVMPATTTSTCDHHGGAR